MLKIQYVLPSPLTELAQSLSPEDPSGLPRHRRLRLYLVGLSIAQNKDFLSTAGKRSPLR